MCCVACDDLISSYLYLIRKLGRRPECRDIILKPSTERIYSLVLVSIVSSNYKFCLNWIFRIHLLNHIVLDGYAFQGYHNINVDDIIL